MADPFYPSGFGSGGGGGGVISVATGKLVLVQRPQSTDPGVYNALWLNNGVLTVSTALAIATQLTVSLSASSGNTGNAITVTVAPASGAAWDTGVTVTPSKTGLTGAFSPGTRAPTAGTTTAVTFTFTPSAVSSGSINATATGMTSAGAQAFAANAAPADGSSAAPTRAIQRSTLLSGYTARPAWNVAGVDYAVGIPTSKTLVSYTTLNSGVFSINNTFFYVRVDGANNPTIDGIDFTGGNGYWLYIVNCTGTLTITNCKFGGTNYVGNAGSAVIAINDSLLTNMVLSNNEIDGGGGAGAQTPALVGWQGTGAGTLTCTYNWMKNSASQAISMGGGTGAGGLIYKYNLVENGAKQAGAHLNFLQYGVCSGPADIEYNCFVMDAASPNGGEFIQLYGNNGGTMTTPTVSNNVMIAKLAGANVSYMVHGTTGSGTAGSVLSGTALVQNNYVDVTNAFGFTYPSSFTGFTISGNVNMVTGGAIS